MDDNFSQNEIFDYNIDYRNMYENNQNSIASGSIIVDKNKTNCLECSDENVICDEKCHDRDTDEVVDEICNVVKVSCRVIATALIIMVSAGLFILTVQLLNENNNQLEKNHLSYTLLCMLKGDVSE